MCDTMVVLPDDTGAPMLFAKNSDREPSEAQLIEYLPARTGQNGKVQCTYMAVADQKTHAVILSRPAWMWGCEMGVNEAGVVGGNQAVFTREPVAELGLTGMDLLRLALERADSATHAITIIAELLAKHPQGGPCLFRNKRFRYHSSFLFADRSQAWHLETAGPYWAAKRLTQSTSISNELSLTQGWDEIGDTTMQRARELGFHGPQAQLNFATTFADPLMSMLSGARARSTCTASKLAHCRDQKDLQDVLSDHAGHDPLDGFRMKMPCAHATWLPTRHAGQTTASMIVTLADAIDVRATGTSAPCMSVFKPVAFHPVTYGHAPGEKPDRHSLFWRHERYHRRALFEPLLRTRQDEDRQQLQAESDDTGVEAVKDVGELWERHRAEVLDWEATLATASKRRPGVHALRPLARAWWALQPG